MGEEDFFDRYLKFCMQLYGVRSYLRAQVMICSDKVAQFAQANATPWANAIICEGHRTKTKQKVIRK